MFEGKSVKTETTRKDSHPTKLKRRPRILMKLSFRELCDSRLSGLNNFDTMVNNFDTMVISLEVKIRESML